MASKYGYMAKIGADTSGLTAALSDVENSLRNTSAELKAVNQGLKLEGGENTENLKNKYDLLGTAIENTKKKLEQLKSAEEAVNQAAANGTISVTEQKKYQQEITNTESRLRQYEQELANTRLQLQNAEKSTDELTDETKKLGNSMDDAGKSAATFGDVFKANVLSDIVMSGLRRLKDEFVDFAKEGIELASDLSEVQNVVDTTFGSAADKINTWAQQAATSFGMSELAAKQYTGTLGAMLKSQGITSDSVVQLSTDLVGLAGDMASFYNLDIETAFEKIRSGISGETEPLKQLGINMSVTNMEAYALAEGIEKPWRKMSQQEQTMLRYQYLLQQTADAQGDFAKTSDSYANQQRIMELTMQNLSAELGEKLLPVALELTELITSSAPSIMNDIEGIGDAAVTVAKYLIEHKEAVISLVTAYGTFKGAVAVGSAVSGAIKAYKTLTTATQAATAAQEANNAAAAANPYVLLISAIVAAGVAIGSYVMQLDSAIEKEKDIKKAADEMVASSEAEARTVEAKAERYKRLYNEYEKTGVATSEMIELAKELQELSPGTIDLIDEETGAYKELSGSIDDVIQKIRLKGIEEAKSNSLESYYNNITEYYTAQAKAYQLYSNAVASISNETLAELEKGAAGAYAEFFDTTKTEYGEFGGDRNAAMFAVGLDPDAFQKYQDAQYQLNLVLDSTNTKIAENEKLIEETSSSYDKLAESISGARTEAQSTSSVSYWGDYYRKRSEEAAAFLDDLSEKQQEEIKQYEETLQAKVDSLDVSLGLRKKSEDEYYSDLKAYLDENTNTESQLYFKQLSRYEDYLEKKKQQEEKAENERIKLEEEAAKEREKQVEDEEKAEKERIEDNIDALKLKQEIDNSYTEEMMWNDIEIIVNGLDKQSELYKKYNAEILKGRKKLSDELKKEEEKAAKEQLDQWKDTSKELSKELESSYKEIVKQKEKAKDELLDIDLSETVTDKDGKNKEVLTDLNEEIKKIDRYNQTLEKLKTAGASDSLIERIQSMNYSDGSRQSFIDTLLGLSKEKLDLYFSDWDRLQAKAEEESQNLVSDDLENLNIKTADAVKGIFSDMPASAYKEGAATAQSYIQGIIDSMDDINDIKAISSILGITSVTGAGTAPAGTSQNNGGSNGSSNDTSNKTPIIINLNDKEYINTTIEDLIAEGKRSGGNTFNL
ncbi:MAG: hypothetical protein ACI4JK_02030 [Oscillospiraceae bacterium]